MPSQNNYAEKIGQFDDIIAFCDQYVIDKYRQKDVARKDEFEEKAQSLLSHPVFSGDSVYETWKEVVEGQKERSGSKVGIATDLQIAHNEDGSIVKDDRSRYYSTEDLYRILDGKVSGRTDVTFMNMIWVQEATNKDIFDPEEFFKKRIQEAKDALAESGKPVLMPVIEDGKHATAGMFRMKDGNMQFVHNDSSGDEIDSLLKSWLEKFFPEIEIIDLKIEQEDQRHNCGPYTINNLLKMADNADADADGLKVELAKETKIGELRKEHQQILENEFRDLDETKELLDSLRERAICGKMVNSFAQFREADGPPKMNDDGLIDCADDDQAKALAESIKKAYEDIGIRPCGLEEKGQGEWVVNLPSACKGKGDPFSMSPEKLRELKEEISQSVQPSTRPQVLSSAVGMVDKSQSRTVFSFGN